MSGRWCRRDAVALGKFVGSGGKPSPTRCAGRNASRPRNDFLQETETEIAW